MSTIVCGKCGAEVFWAMPRPSDPCFECGDPIGKPEVIDGREFLVLELPEVKPRRRRKGVTTKKMARGVAVGKALGAGPPLKIDTRKKRKK